MEWLNKFRYSIVIPYNDDSNSSKIVRLLQLIVALRVTFLKTRICPDNRQKTRLSEQILLSIVYSAIDSLFCDSIIYYYYIMSG